MIDPTNRKVAAMEAVIATGGKQYRVAPGQVIKVERLAKDKGASVEFTEVLLVNDAGQVTVEPKALASAKVLGQVVAERKENKVLVVKFKRRKNYRRHRGHRQTMTAARITKIEVESDGTQEGCRQLPKRSRLQPPDAGCEALRWAVRHRRQYSGAPARHALQAGGQRRAGRGSHAVRKVGRLRPIRAEGRRQVRQHRAAAVGLSRVAVSVI